MNTPTNGLGQRLRMVLDLQHLTQKELAEKTMLNPATISHFINGCQKPSYDQIRVLCKVLKVSADWLMGLKGKE